MEHHLLSNFPKDPIENLHLAFLKWNMGVKRTTSNAAIWGDTGRYPLVIVQIKQLVDYRNRLEKLTAEDSTKLVRHAYCEQQSLGLQWYTSVDTLVTSLNPALDEENPDVLQMQMRKTNCPKYIRTGASNTFVQLWESGRQHNRKLSFYNSVKRSFGTEPFLRGTTYQQCRSVAQLRSSSHRLGVERGRHGKLRLSIHHRVCKFCSTDDIEVLQTMNEMPFSDLIIEDEAHILRVCPRFYGLRVSLPDSLKNSIFQDISQLFEEDSTRRTARYISEIFSLRFPKKKKT